MFDATQLLNNVPPAVGDVLRQVQAGNHAAVPDADAHAAYSHVVPQLSPGEFQQVAADAYAKLTPEQRSQIADYIRTQAQQQGINVPNVPTPGAAAADPAVLADATASVQGQGTNILQQMFAPGGTFSNPLAKMALLGITAMAAQRLAGRR